MRAKGKSNFSVGQEKFNLFQSDNKAISSFWLTLSLSLSVISSSSLFLFSRLQEIEESKANKISSLFSLSIFIPCLHYYSTHKEFIIIPQRSSSSVVVVASLLSPWDWTKLMPPPFPFNVSRSFPEKNSSLKQILRIDLNKCRFIVFECSGRQNVDGLLMILCIPSPELFSWLCMHIIWIEFLTFLGVWALLLLFNLFKWNQPCWWIYEGGYGCCVGKNKRYDDLLLDTNVSAAAG